jgi:hypothetical protein
VGALDETAPAMDDSKQKQLENVVIVTFNQPSFSSDWNAPPPVPFTYKIKQKLKKKKKKRKKEREKNIIIQLVEHRLNRHWWTLK